MTNSPLNLILLGAPGAGKGTQAELLVRDLQLLHISTGDMLRAAVKEGGDLGNQLAEYMNKGALVPDKVVSDVVIDRMSKEDAQNGVMLDGFPRTLGQAEALDSALKGSGKAIKSVIYMKVPEEIVIERLSGRRQCKECGKIFHITNMPSKVEGVCDVCDGPLFQRDDDKEETIKNRLKVYEESTKELIGFYQDKGILNEFDASVSPEDLCKDIKALLQ